jgi:hypothetical protein
VSGGPVGEITERAFTNRALVAVALTQRMAGGEFRFGTASIYITELETIRPARHKSQARDYMATFLDRFGQFLPDFRQFVVMARGKLRLAAKPNWLPAVGFRTSKSTAAACAIHSEKCQLRPIGCLHQLTKPRIAVDLKQSAESLQMHCRMLGFCGLRCRRQRDDRDPATGGYRQHSTTAARFWCGRCRDQARAASCHQQTLWGTTERCSA